MSSGYLAAYVLTWRQRVSLALLMKVLILPSSDKVEGLAYVNIVASHLLSSGAGRALGLQTAKRLCTDADAVAKCDVLHVAPYSDGLTDNLVADTAG